MRDIKLEDQVALSTSALEDKQSCISMTSLSSAATNQTIWNQTQLKQVGSDGNNAVLLTLKPGFCSAHYLAIASGVGDRQDLCAFHILRKKEQRPCCYTVQAF